MLRRALLQMSSSAAMKRAVTRLPVTSDLVGRFVAGETLDAAIVATRRLQAAGLQVSIDRLGEDTTDRAQADAAAVAGVELLQRLGESGLADRAEMSIKLSSLGQFLGADAPGDDHQGHAIALDHARTLCAAAHAVGTRLTLDMEDHTTTDSTLSILAELRADFPDTGAVLQAYLHRTEADCHDLAAAGSRVRLCKGAYREPASVAFTDKVEVDRSYVRCLRILMEGEGYPMVATHDPRLIDIAHELARRNGRAAGDFEFQLLFGIRPTEQLRLANGGHTVRIYLPYGSDWYGYFMRRLAERPANLAFFGRSVITRT